MSEDPLTALTLAPYGYVHDNPLTYSDPSGLFLGIPGRPSTSEVVGAVGNAASSVGQWIYENRTPIGIGLGALSLATGVGAIADVGALADLPALNSVVLGTTSGVSGFGAAGLDAPGCLIQGHTSSCVALGLGTAGAGFGLGATLLEAGALDGPLALKRLLEYSGVGFGGLGFGVDLVNLLEDELGVHNLRQLEELICR
jgi:hypothetical protein